MTALRQRMLDALELRGMAVRTQEAYIDAVARLGRHFGRSPALLSGDEVQGYLLHLLRDRHLARSSVNPWLVGLSTQGRAHGRCAPTAGHAAGQPRRHRGRARLHAAGGRAGCAALQALRHGALGRGGVCGVCGGAAALRRRS